jgi:hypothetical protein
MTEQIPPSLQRFADAYEQAARRELATTPDPMRSRRRTVRLAATGMTAVAAAAAAATVLALSATTDATPAYALSQNAEGGITISLYNLTTGISQLNARLQQLGTGYTVIPVTQGCPTPTPVLAAGTGNPATETITIGTEHDEPAGVDGYLAAEQLPNGSITLGIGGMKAPLPSCFSTATMNVQPINTPDSTPATSGTTVTTHNPPLPVPAAVRRELKAAGSHATSPGTSTTASQP